MPSQSKNVHSEASPHPDGKKESIINAAKGVQEGVTTGSKRKGKELNLQPDEKMREFKKNMENLMDKDS
ncbi:hypothetical protein [Halobacillus sp. BBL2006]|uniref:hypothetical protein n=1 Tax=Halobacillus sp. BBL2006 TaxID=1543706 RepID=UPI0005441443|nr:hypothetical protein [Halobacillus sp. BBL2006]KHE71794.1 hypothetical protein LD39_07930 [Halobacillus sp. BBL2006]